jgi:hypothetical protein
VVADLHHVIAKQLPALRDRPVHQVLGPMLQNSISDINFMDNFSTSNFGQTSTQKHKYIDLYDYFG